MPKPDTEVPVYLSVPLVPPKSLRERGGHAGSVTFELCVHCYSPVLVGKHQEHMETVSHRHPPMGADTPEG